MNGDDLLKFHLVFCHRAYQLCELKNHDYAGATGSQPFRNFESVEALGIAYTETGFLVRMTDKLNRLVTYTNDGKLAVTNESVVDTLLDLINYSILFAAYMQKKAGFVSSPEEPAVEEEVPDGEG